VNDYLQPPKVTRKMLLGQERFAEVGEDMNQLVAANPHELMRALEVGHIYDCALMAAHASLFRTESRWGLYHYRADYPERNDAEWFTHCHLRKTESGGMESIKRPVEPYILPLDDEEKTAYQRLRIVKEAASA
jgi:succinate dehydrogenase/fumarate reductase flavoprotein subunit